MSNENEFNWESAQLDTDESIGVTRAIDGSETRHWDTRRTGKFGGNVVMRREVTSEPINVVPYGGTESLQDLPVTVTEPTSFLVNLPG